MKKEFNLEELFSKAKESSARISSAEAIERFKNSSAGVSHKNKAKKSQFFTKKFIVMFITTIAVSLGVLWSVSTEKTNPAGTPAVVKRETSKDNVEQKNLTIEKALSKEKKQEKTKKEFTVPQLGTKEIHSIYVSKFDFIEIDRGVNKRPKFSNPLSDEKYYPKLTPEEIKENHKQKKKMLKALAKFDKKSYAYIPSGSMKIGEEVTSVQAFYMGVNEVTNLEYRTFMFDLIIQGRKAEFDIARPDQAKWNFFSKDSANAMEENYFSHPAFNDYPVVNVLKEGAELYCKWLTQEVIQAYGDNFNDVRIPVKHEWMFAASVEGKALPYPWGSELKNESGCFLANFDVNSDFPKNGTVLLEHDGATYTARTGTYNPNENGLYNISGNVAELAYNSEHTEKEFAIRQNQLVQCGGGWMDAADELKIDAPKKVFTGPTPNVGFRVVTTYLSPNLR